MVKSQLDSISESRLYVFRADLLCESLGFHKLVAMLFDRKNGVAPIDNMSTLIDHNWVTTILSFVYQHAKISINREHDLGVKLLCTVFCQQETLGKLHRSSELYHANAHGKTFLHHLVESKFKSESAKVTFFKYYFVSRLEGDNKLKTVVAKDINGNTPLHLAVRARCYELAALFLQYGASPGEPNNQGKEPYSMAKSDSQYDKEQCELLNPDNYKENDLINIFHAINTKDVSCLKALLATGIRVNRFCLHRKTTPLHFVCQSHKDPRNVEMAKLLILHGADPSLPTLHFPLSSAIDTAQSKQDPEFFDGVAEAIEVARKQRDEQVQLRQRQAVELSERESAAHQSD